MIAHILMFLLGMITGMFLLGMITGVNLIFIALVIIVAISVADFD